jgi:hypothetical protein
MSLNPWGLLSLLKSPPVALEFLRECIFRWICTGYLQWDAVKADYRCNSRLTISYLRCFKPVVFPVVEYLHTHNEVSWGWNTSINTKLTYISSMPYTHSLKVILHNIFSVPILTVTWLEVRYGMFHLWRICPQKVSDFRQALYHLSHSTSPKFQILEHFGLQIFARRMFELYPEAV